MKSKRMAEAHKNVSSLSTQRTEPPVSKNILQSDKLSEGAVLGNAEPSFEILLLTKGFLVAFSLFSFFAQKKAFSCVLRHRAPSRLPKARAWVHASPGPLETVSLAQYLIRLISSRLDNFNF